MYTLSDHVALVTGASRGIGRRVAEVLAAAGASVAVAARTESLVRKLAAQLEAAGYTAMPVVMDVAELDQVRAGVSRILERFGKVSILVNNAGITRDGLLLRMPDEAWRAVMSTNLDGVFQVTREILPSMLRQKCGRIINITSVVALSGNPGQANYASSKAGVIGFTRSLAREVASRGVTVNAVAPGYIETEMTAKLGEQARARMLESIPLKRAGTVEDVASGVLFLASRKAGYITGHVLNINGGMYM